MQFPARLRVHDIEHPNQEALGESVHYLITDDVPVLRRGQNETKQLVLIRRIVCVSSLSARAMMIVFMLLLTADRQHAHNEKCCCAGEDVLMIEMMMMMMTVATILKIAMWLYLNS